MCCNSSRAVDHFDLILGFGVINASRYLSLNYTSVSGAIKRNAAFKGSSRNEVERSLGKWFTGVRDRDGGRKRRRAEADGPRDDTQRNSQDDGEGDQ